MDNNDKNNKPTKNTDKKSLAYFSGQVTMFVFSLCIVAILAALCCKFIFWLF